MSGSIGLDPRIGTEFLGYRIEALVGRGGMGVVYRAYDLRLKRNVALKLVAPEYASDERFRERFLTETELAAALEHPDVVPIYDAGEVDGQLYLAMRFVEGTDLKRLLTAEAPLEAARALAIVSHVADALDAAHEQGLVHRDVKPSNVLLDEREHPYLADFGLTRRLDDPGSPTAGLSVGTPAYVAPEQIRGDPVDGRADQYALACMLHECLIGEPPFRRASELAMLFAHLEDEPPSRGSALDRVFARALAKDPARRYSSCAALVQDAREALGISESRPRRWPLLAVAVVLALAAGALAVALLTRGGGTQAPETSGRLVRIDPATNRAVDTISVRNDPIAVATGGRWVWVADHDGSTISRVDAEARKVALEASAHGTPADLAVAGRRVVVTNGPLDASAAVFDAERGEEETVVNLSAGRTFSGRALTGVGTGGLWIATADRRVGRLDPVRGRLVNPIVIEAPRDEYSESYFSGIAVGADAVWVTGDLLDPKLWRIDVETGELEATISLPFAPNDVAEGYGGIWVTAQIGDTVSRIDPTSNRLTNTVEVGRGAASVAVGAGSVWVANNVDATVSRIDPRTLSVQTIDVGAHPIDIAASADSVWVAADARELTPDDDAITVAVVAPCEGESGTFHDQTLAGIELALIQRGGRLSGQTLADGVEGATVAGRRLRLLLGCGDGSAEATISEARRFVERAGADIVMGVTEIAEATALREYGRTRPGTTFLNGVALGHAVTLSDPAPNFFRFSTDGAQWMAGVGAYAYHELGWRRVVTLGDEKAFTYIQAAGFAAEFCSLGGSIVKQVWVPPGAQNLSPYTKDLPRTGVDGFLVVGDHTAVLGFVQDVPQLEGNLRNRMVAGSSLYHPAVAETLGARIAGVVAGIQDPGIAETPEWARYNSDFDKAFPDFAGFGSGPWTISNYDALLGVLTALEVVDGDLEDDQQRFQAALADVELDAPLGHISLDDRHQAIAPNYLTPYTKNAKGQLDGFRVIRTVENVEQTFNGYFGPDDPPLGRDTIECKKGNPPPWARRR